MAGDQDSHGTRIRAAESIGGDSCEKIYCQTKLPVGLFQWENWNGRRWTIDTHKSCLNGDMIFHGVEEDNLRLRPPCLVERKQQHMRYDVKSHSLNMNGIKSAALPFKVKFYTEDYTDYYIYYI